MSSRLFHAVVAVGISLGSLTAGCSASPDLDSDSISVSRVSSADTRCVDAATHDPFCEVAWPTTKGGLIPVLPDLACADPGSDCADYPRSGSAADPEAGAPLGSRDDFVKCVPINDGTAPLALRPLWMICDTNPANGPAWRCPTGTSTTGRGTP